MDNAHTEPKRAREESGWLGSRLPLNPLRDWLGRLSLPVHRHSIWYYFGWLTLFLFIVMLASGLLLTVYYEPSAAPAVAYDGRPLAVVRVTKDATWNNHEYHRGDIIPLPYDYGKGEIIAPTPLNGAVEVMKDSSTGGPIKPSAAWVSVEQRIMREVEFGWLIRSLHRYSANLLIAALFIHAFSAMLMRAYRRPRELMWVSGFVLLLLLLAFGFTGYLLPWNRLAYTATRVAVSYPEESLPVVGSTIAELIRGGRDVAGGTLTRMFSLHVAVLPLAALLFMGLHLLLLRTLGMSTPENVKRHGGVTIATTLGIASLALLIAYPILAGEFDPASPYAVLPLTVLPVVVAYLLNTMVSAETSVRGSEGERVREDEGVRGRIGESENRRIGESVNRRTGERENRRIGEEELRDAQSQTTDYGQLTTDSSNSKSKIDNPPSSILYPLSSVLYRTLLCWTLVLGVVLTLALVAPWSPSGEAGMPVDLTGALVTPLGVHPEWYLMFAYQLLTVMPGGVAMLILLSVGALWLLVPFLDRNLKRRNPLFIAFGIVLITAFVGLTVWGYASLNRESGRPDSAGQQK